MSEQPRVHVHPGALTSRIISSVDRARLWASLDRSGIPAQRSEEAADFEARADGGRDAGTANAEGTSSTATSSNASSTPTRSPR